MIKVETNSYNETVEFGKKLGNILRPGDIICLSGDLGTGKTAFTTGIAKALGIDSYITSPTFTLVNEYQGKYPLYHFDVYRISDAGEMFDIGFDEYINSEGITIIEWGELIKEILPTQLINIKITKNLSKGLDIREIEIEFSGSRYSDCQDKLV